MVDLHKFWSDTSVDNLRKYLIFLAIPTNLILWGCEIWALFTYLLNKIEVFLHHSIWCILCINMTNAKEECIKNETARKRWFNITSIKKQISTQQLTFIVKVLSNSDNQLTTNILTVLCNHKIRHGGVLNTNNKSIVQNFRPIILGLSKTGALNIWAHFALDEKYWRPLIYVLSKSLSSTQPPSPPFSTVATGTNSTVKLS